MPNTIVNSNLEEWASRLRTERRRPRPGHPRGFTQAELAAICGQRGDKVAIAYLETARRGPGFEARQRIAAALGVSHDDLFPDPDPGDAG